MTPIGHLAVGFAARRAGAKIPLGIILAAAWLLDVLYFVFGFLGLESLENISQPGTVPSPYSHGLLMALVWSALAGMLAWRAYRSRQAGVLIGLVVFSHWVLDFFTWGGSPLMFNGAQQASIGVGLFKALGDQVIYVELALFAAGIAIYLIGRAQRLSRPAVQG